MSKEAGEELETEGMVEAGESFEDIGDESFVDDGPDASEDPFDFDESDDDETPLFKREPKGNAKAEAKAKKDTKFGDQKKVLETIVKEENEDESEDEGEPEVVDKKPEDEKAEEKAESEEKPKEEKGPKGKRISIKVGEETFAIDSNATIPHKVDGKVQNIPVQELLNNYAGKTAWDKRMNEVNVKNQEIAKKEQTVVERETKINTQLKEVMDLINDPEKNPFDALYKIVDLQKGNRYDFWERSFKTQLEELSNVLAMQGPERSNYFLKKQNEFLAEQTKKRTEEEQSSLKLNRYKEQAAELRKSYNVTETQYVDSYEEIKSWGYKPEEISEKQIVEWAAIKPHAQAVAPILDNYRDQISDESFSELKFKLAGYLRTGQETIESITELMEETFGAPSDVKELNKELPPLGRPKTPKGQTASSRKLESFSDLDEDDDYFN